MYSKEIIEKVKSASDIVSVVRDYQSLTQHGKQWLGVCPFHSDTKPSLTITPSMQIYKCFACGASGDVLSYVQHQESCSFSEAMGLLAKKANIELPQDTEETAEERQQRLEREQLRRTNGERQAEYVAQREAEGSPFNEYLKARKISTEAAERFGLGYAATGEFHHRITYPFYTPSGTVAGWTGRIFRPAETGDATQEKSQQAPKYKNSAESALFKKDHLLFGYLQAKAAIQKADHVYIVEGQNDVIRMHMSGYEQTVAGSGTAFSEEQARLLARLTRNVRLMYDGDNAGRKATLKTMQLLMQMRFQVSVVKLPEGEDPDTFLIGSAPGSASVPTRDSSSSASVRQLTDALQPRVGTLALLPTPWISYLLEVFPPSAEANINAEHLEQIIQYVGLVESELERDALIARLSKSFKVKRGLVEKNVELIAGEGEKKRHKKAEDEQLKNRNAQMPQLGARPSADGSPADADDDDFDAEIPQFEPDEVPDYVLKDKKLRRQYIQFSFYPLLKNGKPVAYVFRSEKTGLHYLGSDFHMEPLLFVDPGSDNSKRVMRLRHLWGMEHFVEFPSDSLISVNDMRKRLFSIGAYNFGGSQLAWDHVRQALSYDFQTCHETRVYGWQPEGFFMFPNGAYNPHEKESDFVPCSDLGVVEMAGERFYSPVASSIRSGGRQESDPFEQDEDAYYMVPQNPKDRMEFTEWAQLMDDVFQVNDNGKWAVMFAIACSFRDLIYKVVGSFTALCFAGPTGSGKSELAYGIRGLWMRRKAPVFNLNSGSDAAFFIVLEHFRNMPVIMEEYNDQVISPVKFQGLKAAVYDDKGRTKVKDISSKSLDTSKTNAAPILLGQDTPQQDDGSLSNRVILCEVPKKEGGFSLAETELFERLKLQAELGMGNIVIDILRQRPVFEKYFKQFFFEEVARMKEATWESTTNKEGLERVIRSVAILSATSRLVEEQCDIVLPWKHREFYSLAVNKIPKQMENISKTSKIGNFFAALNTLMSAGKLLFGRELKVERQWQGKVSVKDGIGYREVEVGVGTQLLYLHFDSCYSAYCREVQQRDQLSKQTLVNYFRSHSAYIGLMKSTRFTWKEASYGENGAADTMSSSQVSAQDSRQTQLEMATPVDDPFGSASVPTRDSSGARVSSLAKNSLERERETASGDTRAPEPLADSTPMVAQMQIKQKTFVSSAYVFNYEILRELLDVDFVRDNV